MQTSLRPCVEIMRTHNVSAGTDVTGFGLAGHLLEMLDASGSSAEINLDAIPVLDGAHELSLAGVESTLRPGNEASAGHAFLASAHPTRALLFDPQTSGGLLFGVPADQAEACMTTLQNGAAPQAAIIGHVVASDEHTMPVTFTGSGVLAVFGVVALVEGHHGVLGQLEGCSHEPPPEARPELYRPRASWRFPDRYPVHPVAQSRPRYRNSANHRPCA